MRQALEILRSLELGVYAVLAAVAVRRYLVRGRGASRAWLAATFGLLAAVLTFARLIPREGLPTEHLLPRQLLITGLVLFPYFLFRFAASFRPMHRVVEAGAATLTAGAVGLAFLFDELPRGGDPRSRAFGLYVALIVTQWVALLSVVAFRLWRAGRDQPTVARRRMRTVASGAVGMALALLLLAAAPSDPDSPRVVTIVAHALAIASAPLFLLGFGPPRFVLSLWRRPEMRALHDAQLRLMQVTAPDEIAAALLPPASRLVGGGAAVLCDHDGTVIGAHGASRDEAARIARAVATGEREHDGRPLQRVRLESGWLAVTTTPYTPYFGRDEHETLESLGVVADLALARARHLERERRAADALREANERLAASNEAMREFIAIASHDLRTPITVIQGFVGALQGKVGAPEEPQRDEYLAIIDRQTHHLSRLVNDLLTMSRIDTGALEPQLRPLALEREIDRALEAFPAERATVTVDVAGDAKVLADEEYLQRMLGNYLMNAFAYGRPPVEVKASRAGAFVELRVRDHGPGVPPEFEPRLFGKFARADKRQSKSKQGTGLGLSIVRGLARGCGGDAWYERLDGGGACFALRLPAADADGAEGA